MADYCPRPSASCNSPQRSSEVPRGNSFDYLPNTHEITVYYPIHVMYYEDHMKEVWIMFFLVIVHRFWGIHVPIPGCKENTIHRKHV